MNFKKVFVAGLTASTLMLGGLIPTISSPQKVEASVATPYPKSLPVEYEWKPIEEYGQSVEKGAFKIDLGNRTGTLVLKLYTTDKYNEGQANTLHANAQKYRDIGAFLTDKNSGLDRTYKGLVAFNRYAKYPTLPTLKYKSGFTNSGTNAKGERFITLGVHIDNLVNDGIYYLSMPNGMNKGTWEVKGYFYDNVNVEERVFNEIDRYFPLLGKVWWDGIELKVGQIGRLTVLKDTPLYKLDGDKKTYSRTLKAGEFYRIYAFKPGKLSVGGGYYVDRDSKVEYQTPSKAKLNLVQMRAE